MRARPPSMAPSQNLKVKASPGRAPGWVAAAGLARASKARMRTVNGRIAYARDEEQARCHAQVREFGSACEFAVDKPKARARVLGTTRDQTRSSFGDMWSKARPSHPRRDDDPAVRASRGGARAP